MNSNLSILQLVSDASFLVQLVLLILVLASIISWGIIFDRSRVLSRASKDALAFEEKFWSGGDLGKLYQEIERRNQTETGLSLIFRTGFREFIRLHRQNPQNSADVLQGTERSMRVALSREMDRIESHVPLLATIGSTSPYIGLFGTVWGIMQSFHALGNIEQATLSLVAPGISEALVATAVGLFAAIPAVIAYNRFVTRVERIGNRYEEFVEEFISLLQRQSQNLRGDDMVESMR